jgi:hypothetical protein
MQGCEKKMPHSRISRRRVLASLGAAPVATVLTQPARARALAPQSDVADNSIPQTLSVLDATLRVTLSAPVDATAGSAIIHGGEADGTFAGVVMPGSLTWTRDPARGVMHIAVRFELQARAGLRIHVADQATVVTPLMGFWEAPFCTTPELTVVDGAPAACHEAVYLGRMDAREIHAGQLRLSVHRVL